MARSLIALWSVLILAMIGLVVFAQFWIQQRESNAKTRVEEILRAQLEPINRSIAEVIEEYSIALQRELSDRDLSDPRQCFEVTRHPLADAVIVVDGRSQLQFPTGVAEQSQHRQSLVDEALQLLREQLNVNPGSDGSLAELEASPAGDLAELSHPQSAVPEGDLRPLQQSKVYYGQSASNATLTRQPQGSRQTMESTGNSLEPPANLVDANKTTQEPVQELKLEPQLPSDQTSGLSGNNDAGFQSNRPISIGEFGWITWYHRRGMVLGFWWNQDDAWRCIVALPRARWMADIVAALPESEARETESPPVGRASTLGGAIHQLVDVEGNLIYQWGDAPASFWESLESREPMAEVEVREPLDGWRLRVIPTDELVDQLAGDQMVLPIWLAVGGLGTALMLGGAVATLGLQREMRQALQRVSFVNQVSHELRTPLTNIRMYADLLARDFDDQDDVHLEQQTLENENTTRFVEERTQALQRITVIQGESQRLSRLINNVLEFARSESHGQYNSKPLRKQTVVMDELVREVTDTFRPRFEELQFEITLDLKTSKPRTFDPDAVEQILINLIGNAEKYAVSGRRLTIETKGEQERVTFRVADAGPGVPKRLAERIFLPFQRVSDRLEDPAGTGIGLTIAREIARRHGGDCRLVPSEIGAAFECTIDAPVVS